MFSSRKNIEGFQNLFLEFKHYVELQKEFIKLKPAFGLHCHRLVQSVAAFHFLCKPQQTGSATSRPFFSQTICTERKWKKLIPHPLSHGT